MKGDGGAAFPTDSMNQSTGMSLRDYFAAAALSGIISSYANPGARELPSSSESSARAYVFADAMLREREKTDE